MFDEFIKKWGAKKLILSVNDLFCTSVAFILALYFTAPGIHIYFSDITFIEKLSIFIFGAILIIPIFRYYQLYKHKYFLRIGEQTLLILKGLLINSIIIIIGIFIIKTQEALHDSRTQVIIYFSVSFTLLMLSRVLILRKILRANYVGGNIKEFITRRAVAVGAGNLGIFFSEILTVKPHYHIELIGFIDENPSKLNTIVNRVPVIGTMNDLLEITEDQEIDEIFITIQNIENKKLLDLIEKCKLTNCHVNLVSNHFDIISAKLDEGEYHDLKVISVSPKLSPLYSEKFKRIFDILAGSFLILVLMPFWLLIALAIKITSKGPVLYSTNVIGKNGKSFRWYKFRTMLANNDARIHEMHLEKLITSNKGYKKLENDPRITFVGKFLRKFSIDELPQLINVLTGNMSLVGPRPCLPYEYDHFKDWHKLKYKVIPGMTGLAQIIARNREDVTFSDSVLLDLYYADNQSLWLDLKILFKTIPVMVFGKGGV
ncbi:MAG: Lipopolysaccharide synthesis sugar transferase [Chlorobi bacterium OLB5]|nr:MAG: Lipopolysaccharide synthesis sugar transferase [Chlorobi bacterium OLB5]